MKENITLTRDDPNGWWLNIEDVYDLPLTAEELLEIMKIIGDNLDRIMEDIEKDK